VCSVLDHAVIDAPCETQPHLQGKQNGGDELFIVLAGMTLTLTAKTIGSQKSRSSLKSYNNQKRENIMIGPTDGTRARNIDHLAQVMASLQFWERRLISNVARLFAELASEFS